MVRKDHEDEKNPSGFFEIREVYQNLENEKICGCKSSKVGFVSLLNLEVLMDFFELRVPMN